MHKAQWNRHTIGVAAVLALGAFLRFFALGQESLWLDELATAARITFSWGELLDHLLELQYHPPLHYVLLKLWAALFGHSELALRGLSAAGSVVSLLMLYKIGILLVSRKTALLATFFAAISQYQILYAQEARFYSLMGMLALLSMYFCVRLWQTPSWTNIALYVLSTSASLYNHSYGIFLVMMQNIFLAAAFLLSDTRSLRKALHWCLAQVILAMTFLPWLFVFMGAVAKIQEVPTYLKRPTLHSIWMTFVTYSGEYRLAGLLSLVLIGYFLWTRFERSRQTSPDASRCTWTVSCDKQAVWNTGLLAFWLGLPIFVPYLLSKFMSPIYSPRYLQASYYPFILMAAAGLLRFRRLSVRVLLILLMTGFSAAGLQVYYSGDRNEQWREAVQYIESQAKPGDCLFFDAWFCGDLCYEYYRSRTDLPIKSVAYAPDMDRTETGELTDAIVTEILKRLEECSRIWLVVSHSRDPQGLLPKAIGEIRYASEHRAFRGIDVYVFEARRERILPDSINPSD